MATCLLYPSLWRGVSICTCATPGKVSEKLVSLGLKKLARLCEELSLSGEIVAEVLDNLPADLFLAYKSRTQASSAAVAYDQQRNCIGPLFGERGLVIDSAAFGDDTSTATASFVSRSYAKNHEPNFLEFSIDEFNTLPKTPLARSDVQTGLSPHLQHTTHMKPTYDVPCTQHRHADATRESIHRLYDHFAAGPAHQPVDVGKVMAAPPLLTTRLSPRHTIMLLARAATTTVIASMLVTAVPCTPLSAYFRRTCQETLRYRRAPIPPAPPPRHRATTRLGPSAAPAGTAGRRRPPRRRSARSTRPSSPPTPRLPSARCALPAARS